MSNLIKMQIFAYSDQEMRKNVSDYRLQVNPASIKYSKEIQMTSQEPVGGQYRAPKYAKHKETSLSFDTIFDGTGIVSELKEGVSNEITKLENVIYNINGNIHRPNYLKISWGSTIFKGVLNSLNYEYTLFAPNGSPLRVKVSFSITGFLDKKQSAKLENKSSPDLSHLIVLKSGDTIASLCNQIYGDPSYCTEVAAYNQLTDFRTIKPGTKIMFPPLQ